MADFEMESPQAPSVDHLIAWYRAQDSYAIFERHRERFNNIHGRTSGSDSSGKDLTGGSRGSVDDFDPSGTGSFDLPCSNLKSNLVAIIGVKTAVGNFEKRQAARETWAGGIVGSRGRRICLRFITSQPGPRLPEETAAALALEAAVFGDVVSVGDGTVHDQDLMPSREEALHVSDRYENLIEKTTGFMEIALREYTHFRYLIMMDDDVYLKLEVLVDWLDGRVSAVDERGFYAGQVITHAPKSLVLAVSEWRLRWMFAALPPSLPLP